MTGIRRQFESTSWFLRNATNNLGFNLAGLGPALLEHCAALQAERLVILDDCFPALLTGFRIAEFNRILEIFDHAIVYSTNRTPRVFSQYFASYPQFTGRVRRLHHLSNLRGSVAYVVFLNNAFTHLDKFEKAHLPFILELYPGGGFACDQAATDERLRRVIGSPQFQKVIVTQNIIRDYVLQKKLCRKDQVEFIYGGVLPSDSLLQTSRRRSRYGVEKNKVDICFAAYKYMPRGLDKGYDRFIGCARILSGRYPQARFHVIGNFNEDDIDVSDLRGRITFYGTRPSLLFSDLYSDMDLIISPNIPFLLGPGAFDGFPTGCCVQAALCGTAMFITDELGMNEGRLKDGEECVIITREPEQIATVVGHYIDAPQRMALLGRNGQRAVSRLFAIENQMTPRLRVLTKLMSRH